MIVPQYWAECRLRHQSQTNTRARRQITVRRFGWSDISQEDAQQQADHRAQAALERLISGEKLPRRDPKVPYNGADGVPIREEIVLLAGPAIITRNSYGARCLNTPDVLFADVDFQSGASCFLYGVTFVIALLAVLGYAAEIKDLLNQFIQNKKVVVGIQRVLIVAIPLIAVAFASFCYSLVVALRGGIRAIAISRVSGFVDANPDWNARIYETPAGLRVLVTHQTFQPDDPEVARFFQAIGADPVYVRMCRRQSCFRARLTAKPWRINIADHLKPQRGVWPVKPERMPERSRWIDHYEAVAADYASCRFHSSVGSGIVHPQVRPVLQLHDELSRALAELPLA